MFSDELGEGSKNALMMSAWRRAALNLGQENERLSSAGLDRILSAVLGLDQGLCILTKYSTIDLHPQKNDTFLKDPKMWVLPRWKERTDPPQIVF